MKNQRIIRRTLLALALSAFGASTMAQVPEQEPNHPIQSAQPLAISGAGSASVRGTVGQVGTVNDVDFYSFQAQEGDVITVNIGHTTNGLDAGIVLFGPGPTFPFFQGNMDAPLDGDSTTDADPRLDAVRLNASGTWTVGVAAFPVWFSSGGILTRTRAFTSGEYTLTISGVSSPVQHVNIDIKPGSGERAPVNPKAKGTVPVALLSSKDFNALDADAASLSFGATGDEKSLRRCGKEGEDVNGDGLRDLVCHFDNEVARFQRGDTVGVLKGKTKAGKQIEGRGDLKVVPEKRSN